MGCESLQSTVKAFDCALLIAPVICLMQSVTSECLQHYGYPRIHLYVQFNLYAEQRRKKATNSGE